MQSLHLLTKSKNLEKIFRAYYQVSHAKRNIQGLGMGLPLVKKIVEALGGEIVIESVPDQGTTVAVTLAREAESPFPDSGSPRAMTRLVSR